MLNINGFYWRECGGGEYKISSKSIDRGREMGVIEVIDTVKSNKSNHLNSMAKEAI